MTAHTRTVIGPPTALSVALSLRKPQPASRASMEFADRLRACLRAVPDVRRLGWNRAIAARLNVSSTTIYGWLNGLTYPSVTHLQAISELTHRSLDYLITGKEWRQ